MWEEVDKKLWLGLWNEIFNEYKLIVLIKILTLIIKIKIKIKMIDLRDFGLPQSPRNREEQLCVNYEYEKRYKKIMVRVMEWDFFG